MIPKLRSVLGRDNSRDVPPSLCSSLPTPTFSQALDFVSKGPGDTLTWSILYLPEIFQNIDHGC